MKDNSNVSKKTRTKALLQNLSLALVSFLIFLLLLEIALRLLGYGNLVIYKPDRKLFWVNSPNQVNYTKVGRKLAHINSKGTRGKEFEKKKPEGVFRIICLGDSRTFGWGLTEEQTYSGLLEKLLQDYVGNDKKIEVINAGVNAWSYGQMYVYLKDRAIEYEPDMVVLGDANLWTQFSEDSSEEFVNSFLKRVWLKNMLRRSAMFHYFVELKLHKFYVKHQAKFIPVDPKKDELFKDQQKEDPEEVFRHQVSQICEVLKDNNIEGIILYITSFMPCVDGVSSASEMIRQVKREVSRKYRVEFIDFTDDFGDTPEDLFFPNDPCHPNVEGNKIIANRIFEVVKREVR